MAGAAVAEKELHAAVAALGRGEVVAYPTETFYGLAVDAFNDGALALLLALKGRGAEKALSILISGDEMIARLCEDVPPAARGLMAAYWPGALTLALPARPGLPAPLVSEGCVAVRESPHPAARALLTAFGRAITATSANPAGKAASKSANDVRAHFGDRCLVLDGGETPGGMPSTLVRVRGEKIEVLREGAVVLDDVTRDTLLRGRVRIVQPARGYRSSLDPVLLAAFVAPPCGRFLDIGCGTGALAFLLLARDPDASGVGVEIQPRLARLAMRACAENGYDQRFRIVAGDARGRPWAMGTQDRTAPRFDLVVTNPPFRPLRSGSVSPDQERAIAHHEVALTLDHWLDVATDALLPDGRLAAIYAAGRLAELEAGLGARGFGVTRLRMVLPAEGDPPGRVLLEAARGRAWSPAIEPPLVAHEAGRLSPEVRRMLGEEDEERR